MRERRKAVRRIHPAASCIELGLNRLVGAFARNLLGVSFLVQLDFSLPSGFFLIFFGRRFLLPCKAMEREEGGLPFELENEEDLTCRLWRLNKEPGLLEELYIRIGKIVERDVEELRKLYGSILEDRGRAGWTAWS